MRQSVVFIVLALALAASAQFVPFFTVSEADRRCAADTECTIVPNGCCASSYCRYAPVNSAAASTYQAIYEKASITNCTNSLGGAVLCPALACLVAPLACVKASGATSGLCGFQGDTTMPPPPPPPPKVESCVVGTSSTCESVCQPSGLAMPTIACEPNNVTSCVNSCKAQLATCQLSANTLSGCAFVATDVTLYQGCVDKCRLITNPPPPPPPVGDRCVVSTGDKCQSTCVSSTLASNTATGTTGTCTATTEVACYNKCQALATCNISTLGCRFIPNNEIEYSSCLKACAPTTVPRCQKTGCSGEICSASSIVSTCQFTCQTACYSAATCATNLDGTCGFTMTETLKTCLAACDGTTNPPPPPPPTTETCKVTGCERELCVASTTPDLACSAIIREPTCETQCLQYATCQALDSVNFIGSSCGWAPSAANPAAYGECLTKCRSTTNPCFVSGCGSVCSTVASLIPCQEALIRPDCPTACKQQFTSCGLTSAGCNFVPVDGLQKCLDACPKPNTTQPPPPPPSTCPSGVPTVQCLANPCEFTKCSAYPNAVCKPDYCGSCRATFWVDGQQVNCDQGCAGLPCAECSAKDTCAFCSGEYSTSTGVTKEFGVCVPASSAGTEKCIASRGSIVDANTCPVPVSGVETSTGDVAPVQNAIAASDKPVLAQFVVLITMIVNETSTKSDLNNVIRLFVDLVGNGVPSAAQKDEICAVLKDAVGKTDKRVVAQAANLVCNLVEKTSVKRDISYVAEMSFPNDKVQSAGVSTLFVSFAAVVAAVLAAF